MQRFLFAPGKALTQPLFVLLMVALVCLLFALRARHPRRWIQLAIASLLLLALLSTHVVAGALMSTVLIDVPAAARPEVIVVASGGSVWGEETRYDVLNVSSSTRIVTAIEWWKSLEPRVPMIITGGDALTDGVSPRTAELMRDMAIARGVPAQLIRLETRSINTRQHPIHVLQMPGITRSTRIGLVTSGWHMRRAHRSFARHFLHVIPHPVVDADFGISANTLLPSVSALGRSTTVLHEWIGIAWYALTDAKVDRRNAAAPPRRVQQ